MRNTLMLLLLGPLGATAQEWCVPGAAWVYRYTYFTSIDFRSEYRYIGDTLIDDVGAHVIQAHSYGTTGGPPIDQYWRTYERAQDDVIYSGNSSGAWDTLYWFGQVGDRWWPIGHPQNCPPEGMLEIVAAGTTTVQGIELATITVTTIDQDGEPMSDPMTITERIGSTPRHPFIWDCNSIFEYFFPSFICYSDEEIQLPAGQACSLTLDAPDARALGPAISLHPNPGINFQLTGLGARPARLRLLDLQGRKVMEASNVMEHRPVAASEIPSGVYLVEVTSANGLQVLRWVKE